MRTLLATLTILFGFSATPNFAAEERGADPPLDAIVVGTVEDSKILIHRRIGPSLFYVRIKMKVEAVEMGRDQVRGAPFLDLRCWREGNEGHRPLPADGARFRAKIQRGPEGRWFPRLGDGIELLDGSAERVLPADTPRRLGLGSLIGGLVGLIALVALAVGRIRRPRDLSWGEKDPDS
jgi:hypothetical protein